MAFSVKQIKAILSENNMPVESLDKAAEDICARHRADLDSIKEERDALQKDAVDSADLKKQLDEALAKIKAAEKEDYKGKYEAEKAAHEKYVADIEAKESAAKKEQALMNAAKAAKYSDDAISVILDSKKDYASRIEFDKDGKATNLDDVMKSIAEDRPALVPKAVEIAHHNPSNPPANNPEKKGMTWEDIDKIKDTAERQNAMLNNMEALGLK